MGFPVAQIVRNLPAMLETWVWSLGQEDPLEKGMATHASILAWRIPWAEEPGGLQSIGLQRVRHDWITNIYIQTYLDTLKWTWAKLHLASISSYLIRKPWWCFRSNCMSISSDLTSNSPRNGWIFFIPQCSITMEMVPGHFKRIIKGMIIV